jgi:hypothetical protein
MTECPFSLGSLARRTNVNKVPFSRDLWIGRTAAVPVLVRVRKVTHGNSEKAVVDIWVAKRDLRSMALHRDVVNLTDASTLCFSASSGTTGKLRIAHWLHASAEGKYRQSNQDAHRSNEKELSYRWRERA